VRANALVTTNAPSTETVDMTVLGSLPILPGEDPAEYERWRAAVIGELKPADLMEKIWTNDIICLEWEIIRFRRAKANFIRRLRADRLSLPTFTFGEVSGEPDPHTDVASVIAANIDALEPLERMIAMMEQRRNAAYHQAEQHRANLGNRLHQAVEHVEDAEFRELDGKPAEQKCAA
jgi:hypothetical protein